MKKKYKKIETDDFDQFFWLLRLNDSIFFSRILQRIFLVFAIYLEKETAHFYTLLHGISPKGTQALKCENQFICKRIAKHWNSDRYTHILLNRNKCSRIKINIYANTHNIYIPYNREYKNPEKCSDYTRKMLFIQWKG